MWDGLEVAQRRYERIRPSAAGPASPLLAEELSLWLETEVCGVVEELVERPDFRARARWPLEHLRNGARGAERLQVEAVDSGLVAWAGRLVAGAREAAVGAELLKGGPSTDRRPRGNPPGGSRGSQNPPGAPVPPSLAVIECIAGRPWRDLVALGDYFGPSSDLHLTDRERFLGPGSQRVLVGEFLPLLNPRLRPLGDCVSRMLLARVAYWQGVLQRFLVRCATARWFSPGESHPAWAAVVEAGRQVQEGHERLREACLAGPEAAVRNACIALVQVYAAYRPRADLAWLGVPSGTSGASVIRYRVERRHDVAVTEQVAAALLGVARLYREEPDAEAVIGEKCRCHALVVVMGRGRREVYWQGQRVEVDWFRNGAPWELLACLVERAGSVQGADAYQHLSRMT